MIFRTSTCHNRPRHYADYLCWQISTILACGQRVASVRFMLRDAIEAASLGHQLARAAQELPHG